MLKSGSIFATTNYKGSVSRSSASTPLTSMRKYSKTSQSKLDSTDIRLQKIFTELLQVYDHSVLSGYRGEEGQNILFAEKKSQLRFPNSLHNTNPSKAIDVAPYPIDWNDTSRFFYLAGIVMGIAYTHGVTLRWGRNWDMDGDFKDNFFNDYGHFEIVED